MAKVDWRNFSLQLVWLAPLVSAIYIYLTGLALKPLFNTIPPLDQRAGVVYASFSVASALLLLGLPSTNGQRIVPPAMRTAFMCGSATAAALSSIGARRLATWAIRVSPASFTRGKIPYFSEMDDTLSSHFACMATFVFLCAGVVVPLLALASPPKPRGDDQRARLARGVAHSMPFVMTYLFEGMMSHFKETIQRPEQGMAAISAVIVVLSLLASAFPGPEVVTVVSPKVVEKIEEKIVKPSKGKKGKVVETEKVEVVEKPVVVVRQAPRPSPILELALRAVPIALVAIAFGFHRLAPFQQGDVRVLSSTESVSGRIIVADSTVTSAANVTHDLRYLRADHSILGGVWIRNRDTEVGNTVDLGDSVFAAFPLQEIAVLARPEEAKGRALVIGLGAGIGAVYYGRRGYEVDVVEYDQAVVDASVQYFGLEKYPPASINVQDGAAYVRDAADAVLTEDVKEPAQKWDVIVQDVFSAGALPVQLFTLEFWQDVKTILKPDGILVMNFPGATRSVSAQAVVNTLIRVFPQCRVFSDSFTTGKKNDISNLVFVCAETVPEFRKPTRKDTLDSNLRERVYTGFVESEVDLALVTPPEEMRERLVLKRAGGYTYPNWDRPIAADSFRAIDNLLTAEQWRAY